MRSHPWTLLPLCAVLASASGSGRAATKPDYVVENIELIPAAPKAGEKIRFQAWMRNIGQGRGYSCKHSIRVGGETTPFTNTIPGLLDPGQGTMMMREAILDRPGRYRVTFKVDVDKTNDESNENNNEAFLNFIVQGPDLVFRNMKVTPSQPKVNQEFVITGELTNIGAVISNWTSTAIYIGGSSVPVLQQCTSISPGQHLLVSQRHTFQQGGKFIVRFIADHNKQVNEVDETNNEGRVSFTVQ